MDIKVEQQQIDASAVLDLLGKEFKFDHSKGIAELVKNSVDAYSIESTPDDQQYIFIILKMAKNNIIRTIEVLDFVGMSHNKIDKAFKIWFDRNAARKLNDETIKDAKVLGGHGNGGKFYMRQMFKNSRIITYRDGKLNSFGFNENKEYGFDRNMDNLKINLEEAISLSDINENTLFFNSIKDLLFSLKRFTIIRGENPKKVHKTNNTKSLIENLVIHPQVRQIIQRKKVYMVIGDNFKPQKLIIPTLSAKKGFEGPFNFICPKEIITDVEKILMYDSSPITLTLHTSEEPLRKNKYRGMNSIIFEGEVGVIANYEIDELGSFRTFMFSEFIYGECFAQIMEDEDYVTNDRNKFVPSPKTEALLKWIKGCIEDLCNKMEEVTRKESKKRNLTNTSEFNKLLNKWKNRFLQKLIRERLAGLGSYGIDGNDNSEWKPLTNKKNSSNHQENHRKSGFAGGDQKKRASGFPEVKISGSDPDPFSNSTEPFQIDPRESAIFQRTIDFKNGIYWINTSKKLANMILEKEGDKSIRWRDYLFQRYIDIIVKEQIYARGKTEVNLSSDFISNDIDHVTSDILDLAAEDLEAFLFESDYEI